jgi:hypothetical protein
MKRFLALISLLVLVGGFSSCNQAQDGNKPKVVIGLAPIADVKISTTLTEPTDVMVYIRGGLRDSCTSFYNLNSDRSGNSVNITAQIQTVQGQACAQIYGFFERCVDLGSDFASGHSYTIFVNGTKNVFTMP